MLFDARSWKGNVGVFVARLATFAFLLCVGIAASPRAEAADLGYRFYNRFLSVGDCYTSYSYYSGGAAFDYDYNTNLGIGFYYNNCSATVIYLQGDYGNTTWSANSVSKNSSGQACSNFTDTRLTYLCNTTDHKAYSAVIYLNTHFGNYPNPNFIVRHELGHVFGMAHVTCSTASVMQQPATCPSPFILQPFDVALINSWYY